MQIVWNAFQAGAESHSSPSFLGPNHNLSVHYFWQETEAYEGLMHSHTYAVPSLPVPVLLAIRKTNQTTVNVALHANGFFISGSSALMALDTRWGSLQTWGLTVNLKSAVGGFMVPDWKEKLGATKYISYHEESLQTCYSSAVRCKRGSGRWWMLTCWRWASMFTVFTTEQFLMGSFIVSCNSFISFYSYISKHA